jgi:hypothetical protein
MDYFGSHFTLTVPYLLRCKLMVVKNSLFSYLCAGKRAILLNNFTR